MSEDMEERLQNALAQLQPQLQADGIHAEFVEVRGAILVVKLVGVCLSCTRVQLAQRLYIEAAVRKIVPELESVWPDSADDRAPL